MKNPFLPRTDEERIIDAVERLKFDVQYALQAAMKKCGVDQAELAVRLGVTPARVSQMFSDDANLRLNSVAKAFAVLDEDIQFSSESAPPVPRMSENDAQVGVAPSLREDFQHAKLLAAIKSIETEHDKHADLEFDNLNAAWQRRVSRAGRRNRRSENARQWQTVAIRSGPAPKSSRYTAANETMNENDTLCNEAA